MNGSASVRLVTAGEVSVSSLTQFYERAFPSRSKFLSEHWRWQYTGCDEKNTKSWPLVAVNQDGQIVGHVASIPITLVSLGVELRASWFVDFFVLPEVRGIGIGGRLIRRVMNAAPIMLAIAASPYSLPVFRRYGWKESPGTFKLSMPLRASDFPKFARWRTCGFPRAIDVGINAYFRCRSSKQRPLVVSKNVQPGKLVELFGVEGQKDGKLKTFVSRNCRYFRWRIISNPVGGEYVVYSVNNTHALCRLFVNGRIKEMNILMLRGEQLGDLLDGVFLQATLNNISRVSMVSSDKKIKKAARRWFWFSQELPPLYYSSDINEKDKLAATEPVWEMIDSDLDSSLLDGSYR